MGDVIGQTINLTEEIYLAEKNKVINFFVNRKNRKKHGSAAWVSTRLRERWSNFSSQRKKSMAEQMKRLYLSTGNADSALQPMYDVLSNDILINYITISQSLFFANSTLFINQIFNDFNSRHAQILDDIVSDTSKFSTRLSLEIGGARILEDRGNYFVIEYDNRPGEKYNVQI